MKTLNRREFLQISGAGLAGLTLSGISIPFFAPKRVFTKCSDTVWKFGVMADTQWKSGLDEYVDPASCATTIIDALNDQFIQHGCKFVIQVGDLVDKETVDDERALPTREAHCQALYDAGIGFFPVRGNHESSAKAAREMLDLFPQTVGKGDNVNRAWNFASPVIDASSDYPGGVLNGLSYMFDFNNVRCVLIDQFVRLDGSNYSPDDSNNHEYTNNTLDQVDWVDSVLSTMRMDQHAFVFAHKNLIGGNHKDNLFGDELTSNAETRDRFITSLCNHGARYYMSGHDHMHCNSLVTTDDGSSSVGQIICASNSYKFYTPRSGDDGREIPIDQELYTIGYYIVTVDGPRVTVDFYSSSTGKEFGTNMTAPPESFTFYLRDTIGYGLNGAEFTIARGGAYTDITDSYKGTTMKILSGVNNNTETDYQGRDLSKVINTGWYDARAIEGAASKVLSLWGMEDNLSLYASTSTDERLPNANENMATDTYTLSMNYDPREVDDCLIHNGELGLASKNESDWVNAVDLNSEGTAIFVLGPWEAGYELGTWGVDTQSHTVWAVVDHCGEFVAKAFTNGSHHHRRDRIKDHRSRSNQENSQSRRNQAKTQDADSRQDRVSGQGGCR